MNLIPFIVVWGILATVVLVLAIYHFRIAGRTDELLHVADAESPLIPQQQSTAKKLDTIDRWGKILTVITLLIGMVLAGLYLYQMWERTSSTISM